MVVVQFIVNVVQIVFVLNLRSMTSSWHPGLDIGLSAADPMEVGLLEDSNADDSQSESSFNQPNPPTVDDLLLL